MCEPIEEIDNKRIADCLGLDSAKFQTIIGRDHDQEFQTFTLQSQISDAERYKHVEKLLITCHLCKVPYEFHGLRQAGMKNGMVCPNVSCQKMINPKTIAVQMVMNIRRHIEKYGKMYLICDDPSCHVRTRQMSLYGKRCLNTGCKGQMRHEYDHKMLATQLNYYKYLVDVQDFLKKNTDGKVYPIDWPRILD